jgi:hypothetical protein
LLECCRDGCPSGRFSHLHRGTLFIDDQQGQIIIITVVVEGATDQHLRSKCQLAFHSRSFRVRDSRCGRESKTADMEQGSTSSEQVRVPLALPAVETVETGAAA